MTHGWSSLRGRARHLLDDTGEHGLCGAPIRISSTIALYPKPTQKRLRALEVCDWCQGVQRKQRAAAKAQK